MFDRKLFFRLLWPVLIEQALATTIGMVNTMMVSGVGMTAISAVSIVSSLNFLIMNLFTSFATGATVVVAQSIGAGDMDKANRTAVQSMVVCVLTAVACGIAFLIFGGATVNLLFGEAEEQVKQYARIYLNYSALSYPFLAAFSMASGILRGSGNTRSPMRISILSNGINVGVGALCIYIFGWGVSGVGIALLLSRVASACLIALLLYHNDGVNIRKSSMKVERDTIVPVLKIGVPTCIDGLIFNGGKLIIQTFVTALGTAALAANSIAGSITELINIPGTSLSLVAVTMVGQAIGSRVYGKELRKIIRSLTGYAVVFLVVTTLVTVPLLPLITQLYSPPDDVKGMIYDVLNMVLLVMPLLWPVAFVLPSCIRSTGDSACVTVVSVLSMWFVRVLGAWFTVHYTGWGLMGIWLFWCTDWLVRGIAFIIRAKTSPYISGKHWQAQPENV
ncbi:MATE family efflux transporter [Thermoclostridium caenicola]|uniref:Probable multidrug resistance protein NorM n=1 Tax=Thermoclostridium caenicola TaxID=659425 RepID=A0A1M6C6S3_9FIRM|nr:MATE family efflux transporter [Thermoclostridium caenicola]SHI56653.1 putative efflux protein, MATE family [Thermoclostridium caenicola]